MKKYRMNSFYYEMSKQERLKYWMTEFLMWNRQVKLNIPFTTFSIVITFRLMTHYPKIISITLMHVLWRSIGLISIELFGIYMAIWIGQYNHQSVKQGE